jgi:hypothetical protein
LMELDATWGIRQPNLSWLRLKLNRIKSWHEFEFKEEFLRR